MSATFDKLAITVLAGEIAQDFRNADGEILEASCSDGMLQLGISWRNYATQETSWCEIKIEGNAIDVREEVSEISRCSGSDTSDLFHPG